MNRLAMTPAARDLMIRNIDEIMSAVARYGDEVPGVGRIREDLAKVEILRDATTCIDAETWLRERNSHDSEDIANVIKEWWLEHPRERSGGDAEGRFVYTEQVYDLMRRLS